MKSGYLTLRSTVRLRSFRGYVESQEKDGVVSTSGSALVGFRDSKFRDLETSLDGTSWNSGCRLNHSLFENTQFGNFKFLKIKKNHNNLFTYTIEQ